MATLVTAKELCKFLKLTDTTIYKLAAQGEIPGFKIGDSWRFDMEEVVKRINKLKAGTKGGK
jgi:excisionase family DNA binding protein